MFWFGVVLVVSVLVVGFLFYMEFTFQSEKRSYKNFVYNLIHSDFGPDVEIVKERLSYDESEVLLIHEGNMILFKTKNEKVMENRKVLWSLHMSKE